MCTWGRGWSLFFNIHIFFTRIQAVKVSVPQKPRWTLRVTLPGGSVFTADTRRRCKKVAFRRVSVHLPAVQQIREGFEFRLVRKPATEKNANNNSRNPFASRQVLKGLDLSLFDMCVGERRKIEIPARLAYGRKGSKLFGIPPDDGLVGIKKQ